MRLLLISLLTLTSLSGEYQPPSPEALLFRRAAIPLDTDRQKELAALLLKAIHRPAWNDDSAQERASAQLISLARQLKVEPRLLQKTERGLRAGTLTDIPTAEERISTLGEIERIILFLRQQERDTHAYRPAALILDPLAVIAPGLPVVTLREFRGEDQRWQGALAES
jgi:hypothetical protein